MPRCYQMNVYGFINDGALDLEDSGMTMMRRTVKE
jgi:hypothetical protein